MGVVEVIEYVLWWWVKNVGFFLDCNGSVHSLLWGDCWMGWHLFVFVFFDIWIAWWVGSYNWLPSNLFQAFVTLWALFACYLIFFFWGVIVCVFCSCVSISMVSLISSTRIVRLLILGSAWCSAWSSIGFASVVHLSPNF